MIGRAWRIIALSSCLVLSGLLLSWRADAAATTFPGEHWEAVADSERSAYDPAKLQAVTEYARRINLTAIMLVVNGRVLLSEGDVGRVRYIASMRKSVLSMLYGNHVAGGKVALDATLSSL